MPYMMKGTCVYRVNEDGEAVGEAIKCHDTVEDAEKHIAALRINVEAKELVTTTGGASVVVAENDQDVVTIAREDKVPTYIIAHYEDGFFRATTEGMETFSVPPGTEWTGVHVEITPIAEQNNKMTPINTVVLSEFRGSFPDVPPAPGVDLKALIEGDDHPMFLTVPISKIGEVSKNGLIHDETFAQSLVTQINADRPGGLRGHLRTEDRSTANPISDIHWLGAILDNDVVWAKGLIPKTKPAVREGYRICKAKGGRVATSVYGKAIQEFTDDERSQFHARQFDLESLDLAPWKRAAAPGSGEFFITSEMSEKPRNIEEKTMTEKITADLVPDTVRQEIVAEYEKAQQFQTQIAELTSERDKLQTVLKETEAERDRLQKQIQEIEEQREEQEFNLALTGLISDYITWETTDEDAQKKADALRQLMRQSVLSELNGEREAKKVKAAADQVWETVQPIVETFRDALAGPSAVVRGSVINRNLVAEDSPEAIEAARAKHGF